MFLQLKKSRKDRDKQQRTAINQKYLTIQTRTKQNLQNKFIRLWKYNQQIGPLLSSKIGNEFNI